MQFFCLKNESKMVEGIYPFRIQVVLGAPNNLSWIIKMFVKSERIYITLYR